MRAYLMVLAMSPGMWPREFMPTEALKDPIEKLSCHDRFDRCRTTNLGCIVNSFQATIQNPRATPHRSSCRLSPCLGLFHGLLARAALNPEPSWSCVNRTVTTSFSGHRTTKLRSQMVCRLDVFLRVLLGGTSVLRLLIVHPLRG